MSKDLKIIEELFNDAIEHNKGFIELGDQALVDMIEEDIKYANECYDEFLLTGNYYKLAEDFRNQDTAAREVFIHLLNYLEEDD